MTSIDEMLQIIAGADLMAGLSHPCCKDAP